MATITMFTAEIRCNRCEKLDLHNGLRRHKRAWLCKECHTRVEREPY